MPSMSGEEEGGGCGDILFDSLVMLPNWDGLYFLKQFVCRTNQLNDMIWCCGAAILSETDRG
jgi:hypothetical protein